MSYFEKYLSHHSVWILNEKILLVFSEYTWDKELVILTTAELFQNQKRFQRWKIILSVVLHTRSAILTHVLKWTYWFHCKTQPCVDFPLDHICFLSTVQFSPSVMSDSLRPHESQHAKPPCASPTPGVHSNSCPSSRWCHPAISSSVVPFSSCSQSLPASESFPTSQLFAWGGQSTGVSAFTSFLPKNTQGWSPLVWTGWISLQSKGLSRVFPSTTVQKHQFFSTQLFFTVQLSHPYMTTGKTIALTRRTFVGKVMSLLFNMPSKLVISFLPRSKRLLISWQQFLPGESQGWGSLVGCRLWGHTESDMTEAT